MVRIITSIISIAGIGFVMLFFFPVIGFMFIAAGIAVLLAFAYTIYKFIKEWKGSKYAAKD